MIKIGEFSVLTGISIHMLRNYDKIGLLEPAYIDVESGYRYYQEEQIPIANQIVVLKELGFGLKEIRDIQLEYSSTERMQEFLQRKMKEKQAEIEAANIQLRKMKQAMQEMAHEEMRSLSVTVKTIPARTVASLRGRIFRFEDEGVLWTELGRICAKIQVKDVHAEGNQYSYAITHHIEFDGEVSQKEQFYCVKEIDVEVQRPIEKLPSQKAAAEAEQFCAEQYGADRSLQFMKIPECEAATLAFQGRYSQIGEINAYMAKWVKKNGCRVIGISFVTYYLSPGNEPNPDNFITEVCFPIETIK